LSPKRRLILQSDIPAHNRTVKLGLASCLLALLAGVVFLILMALFALKILFWPLVLVQFGAAGLGLLSALAGMISSRGQGLKPILSIMGLVLNLPLAFMGLVIFGLVFGQRH
jgi:hypothetical protein